MPTATTRNGFRKPDAGSDNNTWGTNLNAAVFDLVDASLDGWTTISATGTTTLSSTQYVANQARMRMLKYTGATTGTLVIPSVEKWYIVYPTQADCIISNGGSSVTVPATNQAIVITDGADVWIAETRVYTGDIDMGGNKITDLADPTANQEAATKKYVDDTAFATQAGTFPGQPGNDGKILSTNGTNPIWLALGTVSDVLSGTSSTPITGDAQYDSAAPVQLTDAATVNWDTNSGYNAYVILGGNRTIGAPTNLRSGMTYTLELVQDATGSRVPTWASVWDWGAAGTPVLQTTANKADKVFAQYNARTGKLDANFRRGA